MPLRPALLMTRHCHAVIRTLSPEALQDRGGATPDDSSSDENQLTTVLVRSTKGFHGCRSSFIPSVVMNMDFMDAVAYPCEFLSMFLFINE